MTNSLFFAKSLEMSPVDVSPDVEQKKNSSVPKENEFNIFV